MQKIKLFRHSIILLLLFLPVRSVLSEPITFKIGASLPLSGDLSYVGQDIIRGFEIAKKDFDSENFRFEIIVEDDGYQGKNAATAAMKLINVDRVDAIISLWDMAEIIAPMAESKMMPHFSSRWNPTVAEKYDYTMTIESTYKSWTESWVKLLKTLDVKTISIVQEESFGWNLGAEYLEKLLKDTDIRILSRRVYLRSETDYRSILSKAIREKPDQILLLSNPPFVEGFLKIIRQVNPSQKASGYFEIVKDLRLIEGMPYVAQLEPATWFIDKLEQQYKTKVVTRSPQSYDILSILHAAHKVKGYERKLKGADIVNFVTELNDFGGASGKLNTKGTRVIEMECAWKIVREGNIESFPQ